MTLPPDTRTQLDNAALSLADHLQPHAHGLVRREVSRLSAQLTAGQRLDLAHLIEDIRDALPA